MTRDNLLIEGSGGRTYTVTKEELRAQWASGGGNAATRLARTIVWVLDGIVAALGLENIDRTELELLFDSADGGIQDAVWTFH